MALDIKLHHKDKSCVEIKGCLGYKVVGVGSAGSPEHRPPPIVLQLVQPDRDTPTDLMSALPPSTATSSCTSAHSAVSSLTVTTAPCVSVSSEDSGTITLVVPNRCHLLSSDHNGSGGAHPPMNLGTGGGAAGGDGGVGGTDEGSGPSTGAGASIMVTSPGEGTVSTTSLLCHFVIHSVSSYCFLFDLILITVAWHVPVLWHHCS